MPAFEYRIRDRTGLYRRDFIQAFSYEEALEQLKSQDFTVLTLREYRPNTRLMLLGSMEGVGDKALLVFTRQLATMLRAGLPLVRGLLTLSRQTSSHRLRLVSTLLRGSVESGQEMSEALKSFPDVFSKLYVSMVRVGEMGGVLEESMDRLAGFLERDFALRRKVRQALAYPVFVLFVAAAVCWGLVTFIVPRFLDLFIQSGMDEASLPAITSVVVTVSRNLGTTQFIVGAVALTCLGGIALRHVGRTPTGALAMDRLKLNLPILGNIVRLVALARLCRTFGTLLASGLHVLNALDIVGASSGNSVVERAMAHVRSAVGGGEDISTALSRSALFPPMVVQMVHVGETTGTLDEMLHKVADFYDTEIEYQLATLTSLIEPVMILVVGVLVLFIVLAVLLPIVALLQANMA